MGSKANRSPRLWQLIPDRTEKLLVGRVHQGASSVAAGVGRNNDVPARHQEDESDLIDDEREFPSFGSANMTTPLPEMWETIVNVCGGPRLAIVGLL